MRHCRYRMWPPSPVLVFQKQPPAPPSQAQAALSLEDHRGSLHRLFSNRGFLILLLTYGKNNRNVRVLTKKTHIHKEAVILLLLLLLLVLLLIFVFVLPVISHIVVVIVVFLIHHLLILLLLSFGPVIILIQLVAMQIPKPVCVALSNSNMTALSLCSGHLLAPRCPTKPSVLT